MRGNTPWAFERWYRALSYTFRVRTQHRDIGRHLHRLLAAFRVESHRRVPTFDITYRPSAPQPYGVYRRGRLVQRAPTLAPIIDFILWQATQEAVARTTDYLALHAGAVARKGKAVLLPAPPDSGKTTLSAALTRAGFSYLSDEVALIEPHSALVHPYARALWMEIPSIDLMGSDVRAAIPSDLLALGRLQYQVTPEELRPGSVGSPSRVRWIVAPSYRRDAPTTLEPMSRAEALVLLADQSFNFGRFGAKALPLLERLVKGAECYRLSMGDLEAAIRLVGDVARNRRSPTPDREERGPARPR
jgi:HprK-related kinase A